VKRSGKTTNWRLVSGSHNIYGPGGATCVVETAIVAAGFKYKRIGTASDCPVCFSRPVVMYAIQLNDSMPDDLRKELLSPFIFRLAGTADTREIEMVRGQFMVIEGVRRIAALLCDEAALPDIAKKCREATTLKQCMAIAPQIRKALKVDGSIHAASAAVTAAAAYAEPVAYASGAAYAACAAGKEETFRIAVEILDAAIRMGKHSEIEVRDVATRLGKTKAMIAA
jgi:hypothetical protein